jgi:lysozyme family protein
MLNNWQKSLDLILKSEGGYVDNPADPGGRTNLGVTQKTWESWVGRPSNEKEMRALTPSDVAPLYKKKYWDAICGDDLPSGVDYLVFDFAINAGVGRSAKTLQSAVGTTPDGAIGKMTIGAVNKIDKKDLINKFSDEKVKFYQYLPTFSTFGKGWLNRVASVKEEALKM